LHIIADYTGDNSNYLHEIFKEKYLGSEVLTGVNGIVNVRKTTTKLSVKEFSKYMSEIELFAKEYLKIKLPTNESNINQLKN